MAPWLRLKSSKRTSKCQVFSSTGPEKPQGDRTGALKRGTFLGFFNIHSVAKYQKNEGDPLETLKIFEKKSHNAPKKSKSGAL